MLLVVSMEGGLAPHVVCCAESQITGSPPLLYDLDMVLEMEHEGPTKFVQLCSEKQFY